MLQTAAVKFNNIACGERHALAVSTDGRLFTWGCGEMGRLGHGDEDDHMEPTEIDYLPNFDPVVAIAASSDASMAILKSGVSYATGSNEFNKIGLTTSIRGFEKGQQTSFDIAFKTKFSIVKPLKCHEIVDVSMGKTHTVCIDSKLTLQIQSSLYIIIH